MFSNKAVLSSIILGLVLLFLYLAFFKTESEAPALSNTSQDVSLSDQARSVDKLSSITKAVPKKEPSLEFSEVLKVHAQKVYAESVLADVELDGAIEFNDEKLVLTLDLRKRLDAFLLLYPDVSLEGIAYLLSQDNAFNNSQKNAEQRFEQLEETLTAYFNLQKALENKPLTKPTEVNYNEIIDQLSSIRKEILGEELALAFFAEEEDFVRSKIPSQSVNFSEIERQAQQAADDRAVELEQQDNN